MFNYFSFIYLFIKKKVTKRGLKIVCNFLIFLLCLNVVIKWHTVPTMQDEITIIDFYTGTSNTNDDNHIFEIKIQSPYYAFSTKDSAESKIGFKLTKYFSDKDLYIRNPLRSTWFSFLDKTKYKEYVRNIDSVRYLYLIDITKTIDINPLRFVNSDTKFLVDTLYQTADAVSVVRDDLIYNGQNLFLKELLVKCGRKNSTFDPLVCSSIKQKRTWRSYFDLHDIAQMYYQLKVHKLPLRTDSVTLTIDFGGATRFAGIYPAPDETNVSSIKFTNQNKLKLIEKQGGIKLYCQFLETSGIQSARIYILSTIATFFFGLFAKGLLETDYKSIFQSIAYIFRRKKNKS